jgi:hypothetical protein
VSKLLIEEPPLVVLPSLVNEVGLPAAILLQQVHFAGRREPDGWVERTVGDWHRALRGCLSKRTIERALSSLRDLGWVDSEAQPGGATRYRVGPAKLAGVSAISAGGGPPNVGGSVSREGEREKSSPIGPSRKPLSPDQEPVGFAQWLAFHVLKAQELFGLELSVPRSATSYRTDLARTFAALAAEGHDREDFELASLGVLGDPQMREGGWVKPENVLRKTKFGGRIDAGRRVLQSAAGTGKFRAFDE